MPGVHITSVVPLTVPLRAKLRKKPPEPIVRYLSVVAVGLVDVGDRTLRWEALCFDGTALRPIREIADERYLTFEGFQDSNGDLDS